MKQFIQLMQDYNVLQLQAWAPERLDRKLVTVFEKNISYVADHNGVIVDLEIIMRIIT